MIWSSLTMTISTTIDPHSYYAHPMTRSCCLMIFVQVLDVYMRYLHETFLPLLAPAEQPIMPWYYLLPWGVVSHLDMA